MRTNKEIFQRYQQEKNMGTSKALKLMDKQVVNKFGEHVQKNFFDVTKDDVVAFFDAMENGILKTKHKKPRPYGRYTIAQYKTQIKKFYKWLYKWEEGDSLPEQVRWLKPKLKKAYKHKTRKDILTIKEVEILINSAETIRDKAIVAVLYDSATRISEFADLKIGSIIRENGKISIVVEDHEGNKTREIPLNMSIDLLNAYLKTHPFNKENDKPLWITQYGEKISTSGIYQMIKKIAKDSPLQKKYAHIFLGTRG